MEGCSSHLIPRHSHRRGIQVGCKRLGFSSYQDDRRDQEDQEGSVKRLSGKDRRPCNISKSIVGRHERSRRDRKKEEMIGLSFLGDLV